MWSCNGISGAPWHQVGELLVWSEGMVFDSSSCSCSSCFFFGGVDFWLFTSLQLPFGLNFALLCLTPSEFLAGLWSFEADWFWFQLLGFHRKVWKLWMPGGMCFTVFQVRFGIPIRPWPSAVAHWPTWPQKYWRSLTPPNVTWLKNLRSETSWYRTNFGNKKTSENRIWGDLWSLGVVAFVLLFGPLANFGPKKRSRCCCNQRVELGYMPFSGAESKQIRDIKDWNDLKFPHLN